MAKRKKTKIEKAITAGKRTANLPNTNRLSVAKAVARKLIAPKRSAAKRRPSRA